MYGSNKTYEVGYIPRKWSNLGIKVYDFYTNLVDIPLLYVYQCLVFPFNSKIKVLVPSHVESSCVYLDDFCKLLNLCKRHKVK